ncbi:MAG: triose-phosphate isomerase [Candidatus Portnoybacteria bacterium]|nr:triose-phosphate isomerase [Candidatus Portnoybacteria bacterium]
MNKILIIANWKCNPVSVVEARNLLEYANGAARNAKNAEVIICLPFVFLSDQKNQGLGIALGAQDCFWEQKGAYTGEVSPAMLKNLECKYVIVGHSERRKYFGESGEIINKKIKAALSAGLKPIFCVGEKHDEKEIIKEVLEKQLFEGLVEVTASKITDLIIAYEPVWAISSEEGEYCSPEYAFSARLIIKKFLLKEYDKTVVDKIRIIYGGSVDSKDAISYIKEGKMAGVLVGKASLNAMEFGKIIKSVDKILVDQE